MKDTIEINLKDLSEEGKILLIGLASTLKCTPQEAASSAVNAYSKRLKTKQPRNTKED